MIDDPTEVGVQLGESAAVGRVFPLVPYRRFLDGMAVSKVSRSEEDVQEAFENALKGQVPIYSCFHTPLLDGLMEGLTVGC